MKYFSVIVTIILLISLIMNFTLSSKVQQVENQLVNISNNQQQILSSVNSQVDNIRFVMNDIQKQQSWISEITMDVNSNDMPNDQMTAQFNWQVKDQSSNSKSKVMFHYALGGKDSFTSIAADDLQNGLYQVEIPLNIHLEPQWEIFLREQETESTDYEMDKKRKEEVNQQSMRYFVSVTDSDTVKSSEISTWYVGELGTGKYGVISVNLDPIQDHSSIMVTTYKTGVIEKLQLLRYKNESLVDEQEFMAEFDHYIMNDVDLDSATRLVLRVTYKDGETFEKVIYE
jgi:hypothetical protein